MILTEELIFSYDGCKDGFNYAVQNNLIGKELKEVKEFFAAEKQTDFYIWMKKVIESPEYVISKGNYFMNEKYKVFNPLTGLHTTCNSLEEVTVCAKEIANEMLKGLLGHPVVQEIQNDAGDTAWDTNGKKIGDLLEITPKSLV